MLFSKLYLSAQYFQNFTFSSHVKAILMSVKKNLRWSPVEVEKMDDNQFCELVQIELMSILEFMQEAQKRQKM